MNQLSDTRKLRLVVSKIIVCLAVLVWFGFAGLFVHYSRTRPTVPNLDEGISSWRTSAELDAFVVSTW